jgi:predicted RNA-binding Zn ribbon-like protein
MDWSNPKPAPGPLALVQDFINTRNYLRGGDLLEDAEAASTWLAGRGLLGEGERIEEAERRLLITFREGLRTLLLARNGGPPPDLELLGTLAAPATLRVRFGPDGRPAIEPGSEGDPAGRVVARLLAVVIQAEEKGTWERLKACRNEDCKWAFYDAAKNRSGSWCNMSICGARHKMRAYRKRKSGSR